MASSFDTYLIMVLCRLLVTTEATLAVAHRKFRHEIMYDNVTSSASLLFRYDAGGSQVLSRYKRGTLLLLNFYTLSLTTCFFYYPLCVDDQQ